MSRCICIVSCTEKRVAPPFSFFNSLHLQYMLIVPILPALLREKSRQPPRSRLLSRLPRHSPRRPHNFTKQRVEPEDGALDGVTTLRKGKRRATS